jgi:SAM-dependent methyltransferase
MISESAIPVNRSCNVCGYSDLSLMLSLPDYPLNSLYLATFDDDVKYLSDFDLYSCRRCLHVQGTSALSIDDLYNEHYSYTVNNSGARGRQDFFFNRVLQFAEGRRFNRVIELGCFDLSLLKKLKANGLLADHWIGIDPVPLRIDSAAEDILFLHGYFQDIDIPFLDKDRPDLIISDQVFEHVPSANDVLSSFSKAAAPDSTFIVCVPSLELLIDNFSFHNIIHEHLNYFSAGALAKLFGECNFDLRYSELNNEQTVGLLLQTYTNSGGSGDHAVRPESADCSTRFRGNFRVFENNLAGVKDFIRQDKVERIYGFGASDITANLAYFMKSDFSELHRIIDDTPYKQNRFIPHLKPSIVNSDNVADWRTSAVLITAPQASRPIIAKLLSLKAKKIICPINVF